MALAGSAWTKPKVIGGAAAAVAVVAVVAMAALGVGPFAAPGPPPGGQPPPSVQITNFSYQPNTLAIPVGTEVVWTNLDTEAHTVTVGGHGGGHTGSIDSGLIVQGASFRYTFAVAGTYDYHCDPHPYMVASIVVTA